MKLRNLVFALLFFSSFSTFAQGEKMKEKREQIKAMKVAFITTELDLNSSEAEKFWPIYNAFEDENNKLRRQSYNKRKVEDMESLTELEAKKLLSQRININLMLFLTFFLQLAEIVYIAFDC